MGDMIGLALYLSFLVGIAALPFLGVSMETMKVVSAAFLFFCVVYGLILAFMPRSRPVSKPEETEEENEEETEEENEEQDEEESAKDK